MKKVRRNGPSRFSLFSKRRTRVVASSSPRRLSRPLASEHLEERALLAGDVGVEPAPQFESPLAAYQFMYAARAYNDANPDHNWSHAPDVDANGRVELYDLLSVVDPLRDGARPLGGGAEGEDGGNGSSSAFIDVNGDRYLSISDALAVVQAIRAEGEAGSVVALTPEISAAGPVTVGGTFNVGVLIQDLRMMDPNPNNFDPVTGEPIEDRGVFAAVTDLTYNADLSGIPLTPFLSASQAAARFGPTYANQDLSVLDQRVGEGRIRINGAVANLLVPPGPEEFVFATIPFKVGAIPDFRTTPEETPITIDVLGNDTSASGTQTVTTTFVTAQGQVVLVFVQSEANENRNGQGVAESDIMFGSDTIEVSVPGAPTLQSVTDPPRGTATIVGGQVQYTPDPNFFGNDTFSYTIVYPGGVTDTATVTVSVSNTADPPVANNDMFATAANVVLNQPAPGVLANDTDPDINPNLPPNSPLNDRITVTDADTTSTLGATVAVNADGSFSYDATNVPAIRALSAGETVNDTFSYTISDRAGATDTATVTITVTGVNDPPDAVNDTFTLDQMNGVPQNLTVLANDDDVDGDALTITAVTQGSMGGAVQIAPGGLSVNYQHAADFEGTETFTYTISDGQGGTDTATVTVEVIAQALRAVNDQATAVEQGPAIDIPITANDRTEVQDQGGTPEDYNTRVTHINGQPVNGPFVLPSGATVEFIPGATFAQAIVRYTPPQADPGFFGNDTFTYTIDDNTSEDPNDPEPNRPSTGTVTVTVQNVNDPLTANDDPNAGATNADQLLIVAPPGVLGNDVDQDNTVVPGTDTLVVIDVNDAGVQGELTVNPNGGFTYDPRGVAAFRALPQGATATETFVYTASDRSDGSGFTDTATATITVTGVNDAPTAGDVTAAAQEDGPPVTGLFAGDDVDTDDNPDSLTYTILTQPSEGSASNVGRTFTFTPGAAFQDLAVGETRVVTFTYQATDNRGAVSNTGTVTVTVTGVNDAPNAADDEFTLDQNRGEFQPLTGEFNPLANDTDVDGDPLTITGLGPNNASEITLPTGSVVRLNNGVIEYQNNGTDVPETFTYTISDGQGGTDTATITLNIIAFVPSTISGFVFVDRNGNGVKDPTEVGLAGVQVTLSGVDLNGNPVDRPPAITDANGFYEFTNLPPNGPGGYQVSIAGVPFMVDGDEAASTADDVSVTGGPLPAGYTSTAGDNVITINLPELGDVVSRNNNFTVLGLSPDNVSLADIIAYGTEYPRAGLASVNPSGASFLSVPTGTGWEQFAMPTFRLNGNNTVTINARRLSDNAMMTTTVPLNTPLGVSGAQVKSIGVDNQGNTLLKFNGSPANLGFAPAPEAESEADAFARAADAIFAEGF